MEHLLRLTSSFLNGSKPYLTIAFAILINVGVGTSRVARADNLICGARGQVARFHLSYRYSDPGTIQITAAEARVSALLGKSDIKERKYWGRGRPPHVNRITNRNDVVEVQAHGGIMGRSGTLVFPLQNLIADSTQIFAAVYLQPKATVGARRVEIACQKY